MIKYPPAIIYEFDSVKPVLNLDKMIRFAVKSAIYKTYLEYLCNQVLEVFTSTDRVPLCITYNLSKEIKQVKKDVEQLNKEIKSYE